MGEFASLTSKLLEATCTHGRGALSSSSKPALKTSLAHTTVTLLPLSHMFLYFLLSPSSGFKIPWDYIGPIRIIQYNFPISRF